MFSRESIETQLQELLIQAQAQGDPYQLGVGLERLIETLSPVRLVSMPDEDIYLAVRRQLKLAQLSLTKSWEAAEQCIRHAIKEFGQPGEQGRQNE
jgi:hypothetical protein